MQALNSPSQVRVRVKVRDLRFLRIWLRRQALKLHRLGSSHNSLRLLHLGLRYP